MRAAISETKCPDTEATVEGGGAGSGFPELVNGLMETRAYREKTTPVELVETRVSYLFLTDRYVYNVKKPVDYGFLDFTTSINAGTIVGGRSR